MTTTPSTAPFSEDAIETAARVIDPHACWGGTVPVLGTIALERQVNARLKVKEVIAALLSAQSSPDVGKAVAWQPIETAPKDGTAILMLYSDGYGMRRYSIRYWGSGEWNLKQQEAWVDEWRQSRPNSQPSHWMPLPDPPNPNG